MKRAVIFFLVLCFHLLGGNVYTNASTYNGIISSSTNLNITKTQNAENANASRNYLITTDAGLGKEDTNLFAVEDEDEDEQCVIRKRLFQAKDFVAFCYAFISIHHYNGFANATSFYAHLSYTSSCKYILHRVFRI